MSSLSSSHGYAIRRAFQRLGQLLETLAFTFDVPIWILDHEGNVVHKSTQNSTACEFIHGHERGFLGCNAFHRTSLLELSTFREPVVKSCYMGLGKILCPLRIENTLMGAIGVYPVLLKDYSPDEEQRLDMTAEHLGVSRSAELNAALRNVRTLSTVDLQRLVRALTAVGEEIASSSFELADTVSQLVTTYDELTLLYRMSELVGMEMAVENICEHILQEVAQMLEPRHAFLMLVNESHECLVTRRVLGLGARAIENLRVEIGEGIIGKVALTGEGVIQNSLASDPIQRLLQDEALHTIAVAPLKTRQRILGVVVVADKESGEGFVANDLKFVQALAGPTAIALEHARLSEERIRAEKELAWSGIAFAAAHKIGNALFGLEGYLRRIPELLQESNLDAENLRSAAASAQHTANGMKRIIQEFKDFARADELRRSPVDLNRLLHRLGEQLSERDGRWMVTEHLHPDIPKVSADPDRLDQIFGELIENASHAMPDGGEVMLTTDLASPDILLSLGLPRDLPSVSVTIADRGSGVLPENKERIFDSFFTTRGTGTGLGLAIVRKYVELHRGRVVENGEPGKGAQFTVILPI